MRKLTIFLLVAAICGPIYRYSITPANPGSIPDASRTETQETQNIVAVTLPYFHSTNEVEAAIPAEFPKEVMYYTEDEVLMVAKVLQRECGSLPSVTEQACVAWTICNRVDSDEFDGDTVTEIVTARYQFAYYYNTTVTAELYDLASDVLTRWNAERNGKTSVGRVLPRDYTYFAGDGTHNYFRNGYKGDYSIWDYSLPSPYES